MFDTIISFALGTLLGVCLTLLFSSVKNKRKSPRVTDSIETIAPLTATTIAVEPSAEEAQPVNHEALKPLTQNTAYFEQEGNGRATLTGFEVLEVEQHTQVPTQLDAKNTTEEIERIDHALIRDVHVDNAWIEAERVEAERVEAELIEAVRLEALHLDAEALAANRREVDRLEAERIEADRLEAESIEAERIEAERVAAERVEAERVEAERVEAESIEAERVEAERVAAERVATEHVEAERLKAERIETERLEQEFATLQAAERAAEEAAKEIARLDVENAQRRAAEESARLAAEQAAAREQQRQQEEQARIAAEKEAEKEAQRKAEQLAAETAQLAANAIQISVGTPEKISKVPADILIMVADDSKVVRVKTSRVLAKHEYQVSLAEDGNDAANQIDFIMPDLLITDVEMPGMDGFALTKHLRANPITAHLPIIMISGASDELVDKAKLAGIDVLLGKPYSDDDLIGHIRRLVQGE